MNKQVITNLIFLPIEPYRTIVKPPLNSCVVFRCFSRHLSGGGGAKKSL